MEGGKKEHIKSKEPPKKVESESEFEEEEEEEESELDIDKAEEELGLQEVKKTVEPKIELHEDVDKLIDEE